MQIPEITDGSIAVLVDRFYAKVRSDRDLGPIFEAAIADDAWPAHLGRMNDFWSSVMLTSGRYKGNPFAKHLKLEGLTPALFSRWLELFGETADELFTPD